MQSGKIILECNHNKKSKKLRGNPLKVILEKVILDWKVFCIFRGTLILESNLSNVTSENILIIHILYNRL